MPNIDPTTRFWIGVFITIAVGFSQGAVSLSHAIPEDWIPVVSAWSGIIAFAGSAFLTTLNGLASTASSRIAGTVAVPEVKKIETTSVEQADQGGDKVVPVVGYPLV